MDSAVLTYDPLHPDTLENPYPIYKKLRETTPIFWHERMKSWVLTRHDDCMKVLQDSDLFALDMRRVGVEISDVRKNLQSLDPPENGPLRALMMKAFKSQDIENIRAKIRTSINSTFQKQETYKEFDWMKEVSAPLALSLTSILLGVEEPELELYMEISDAIAYQMDSGLSPENFEPGEQARKN